MPANVLLVHSSGLNSRQWRALSKALESTHRVLAPDLLGYTPETAWPVGKPFHFREDLALLTGLLDREGPAHVVGHSYGGLLALQLALVRPDLVRSVAAFEPVAFGVLDPADDADAWALLRAVDARYDPSVEGGDARWMETFVDWWSGPGAWAALGPAMRAQMLSWGWKVSQEVAAIGADRTPAAAYAKVSAPTLLLTGDQTPLTERRVVEKLARALPNATLRSFEGVGHMGPLTHGKRVNQALLEFLAAQ